VAYTMRRSGGLEREVADGMVGEGGAIGARLSHSGAGESAVADGEDTGNGHHKATGGHAWQSVGSYPASYDGGQ
jgi:hypothetical protein